MRTPPDPGDPRARELARAYVEAHPRPATGVAQAQRLALLRRLGAGPASTATLLAAMRTAGWVGSSDLENRLRELRGTGRGAGAEGLAIRSADGRHRLTEPLPRLDEAQTTALGFAKAMLALLEGPMAGAATHALDDVLPGLSPSGRTGTPPTASLATLDAFHEAWAVRRPVRVTYDSRNRGLVHDLHVLAVEYATLGGVVKALCLQVDADGRRAGEDRQLALERIIDVAPLPDWQDPDPTLALERQPVVLVVSEGLRRVLQERDVLGTATAAPRHPGADIDAVELQGSFPLALAWDVMEQLCSWAGSVQVREPLWLVNAVCRRLRAGLREMETAAGFELVKPDPGLRFDSHAQAVAWEPDPLPRDPRRRARRLPPPP